MFGDPRPVLVLGAYGFLGRHAAAALATDGFAPRCGFRRRPRFLPGPPPGPAVPADLDDPASLAAAMAGAHTVVHAAGHYPVDSLDRAATLATGVSQTRRVLDAAAAAGIRRLVYLSSTATVAPRRAGPSDEADTFAGPPGFGVYHDLKWAMERVVLAEDRFEVVVACPAGCLGPGDVRFGTSGLVVALARGADPPHPDGLVSLVDARDVGLAVARLVALPSPPARVLLSGGTWRLPPLLADLARRYGVAPPSPPLSAAVAEAAALSEERRARAEGRRPALSREIVDLVVHGVPLSARLASTTLGLAWTPLAVTLDRFDTWARRFGVVPRPPPPLEPPA